MRSRRATSARASGGSSIRCASRSTASARAASSRGVSRSSARRCPPRSTPCTSRWPSSPARSQEVEAGGYDATTFRVDYHAKLAEPLACVVLPAVVLFFAVTGPPFPGPAQTLLVSGIVGVVYILFSGVAASLGYGGAVPPAVGGWGPVLLFGGSRRSSACGSGGGASRWRCAGSRGLQRDPVAIIEPSGGPHATGDLRRGARAVPRAVPPLRRGGDRAEGGGLERGRHDGPRDLAPLRPGGLPRRERARGVRRRGRRLPVRRDPDGGARLDPRARADALAPLRHLHAVPEALRERRAEGEVPAAHDLGRADPRHRHDRARRGLGSREHPDPRDPRRRRLRAERRQDLHLERADRRSVHRGREDRSRRPIRRIAASACCSSKATRPASGAGASSTSSGSRGRTRASSPSRTAGSRRRICSAAKGRASRC